MGDPRGFLKIGRKPIPKRLVEERIHDYRYVYEPMPEWMSCARVSQVVPAV